MTELPIMPPVIKTDFYLKFQDEITAKQQLMIAGFSTEVEGEDIICSNENGSVNVIGIMYKLTGEYMNMVSTPMQGYHVNIRTPDGQLPASLEPYIITPKTPRNVWA